MSTLKLQSSGTLYSNAVIGTLAVDGLDVIFGTARWLSSLYRQRPMFHFVLFEVAL